MLGCLALIGCETPKDPLPGNREDFIGIFSSVPVDVLLRDKIVPSVCAESTPCWAQVASNAAHRIPASKSPQLLKKWERSVGCVHTSRQQELFCQPLIHEGIVYTIDANGLVHATDAQRGAVLWTYPALRAQDASDQTFGGGLCIDDAVLYITTSVGDVVALDLKTRQLRWRAELKIPMRSSPTVADRRVFVINVNNELIALDAQTGQILWNYVGLAEPAFLFGSASPAYSKGLVVAPFSSGEVVAFQNIAHIQSQPVIADGIVYAISFGGRLAAIHAQDGSIRWSSPVGSRNTPVLWDHFMWLISHQHELMCYDTQSGRVKWSQPLNATETPETVWFGPLITDRGLLVLSSNGTIARHDMQTGICQQTVNLHEQCSLAPTLVQDHLYVLTDQAKLLCIE